MFKLRTVHATKYLAAGCCSMFQICASYRYFVFTCAAHMFANVDGTLMTRID